ncbi:MAG TPA: bifunctional riboflavin kinase/FAD synthetase [Patescibacteria group bacterium]|nr:bifunctional riboflavin kinase/FAD synthetase [Patescibacteria group bacterium]
MRIITRIEDLERFENVAVGLGTFDGVHIGHQRVISRVAQLAAVNNGTGVVFTFSNHPLAVIEPERCPLQIISQEEKAAVIESLGIDVLVSLPFTRHFLKIEPAGFIRLLLDKLDLRHIVVGPNYSFGYRGAGSPEMLRAAGKECGFSLEVMDALRLEDVLVSSTLIRQLVADGNMEKAAELLGRPWSLTQEVVTGDRRGHTLGFPTANMIFPADRLIPADGVYVAQVETPYGNYLGVANVGDNPTFNGRQRRMETHLMKFTGDLYGQVITVRFLKRLRGEMVFSSRQQLQEQIQRDIEAAISYRT